MNPNELVAVIRNPREKELTEEITRSKAGIMPVPVFPMLQPKSQAKIPQQAIVISNVINHGTISVALTGESHQISRLEGVIIPEGGIDASEAVDIDSRLFEKTKEELKVVIQDIVTEYGRGENADRDKVQAAIARLNSFLDRAEGAGKTIGRVVTHVSAAASWIKRIF